MSIPSHFNLNSDKIYSFKLPTESPQENKSIDFQNQGYVKSLVGRVKGISSKNTTTTPKVLNNPSPEKTETETKNEKSKKFLDGAKEKFLGLFSKKELSKTKVDLPQDPKTKINFSSHIVTSTFERSESQEIEEPYKEIFTNFDKLSSRIDPTQQLTIRSTLKVFSSYDKNLKNIIPKLIQEYDHDGAIPKEKLSDIQRQLHTSVGSHLGRIKNPTPRTIEKYFQGQLNQVKELYESSKQEDHLESFYAGCYSRFPGCFEDRILHLYKSTTAEKELQATALSKDNSEPLLPLDVNVALSRPNDILAHYHHSFTTQQEAKMKDDYPELKKLTISKQLDYREEHKLDKKYLSRSQFEAFLATTKISQLQTSQGKVTATQIEAFWNIISTT